MQQMHALQRRRSGNEQQHSAAASVQWGRAIVEAEKQIARILFDGALVRVRRVLVVAEPRERDGEVHVGVREVGLEVDGGGQVGKGGGELRGVEVHEAEVIARDPLKGAEVEGALEARDGCDVALLAKVAEAHVVPDLWRREQVWPQLLHQAGRPPQVRARSGSASARSNAHTGSSSSSSREDSNDDAILNKCARRWSPRAGPR